LVRGVDYKVDKYLNLRLGEEIKGLQVGYHRMGRSGRGSEDIQGSAVVALTYVDYGPHHVGPR
jgi:hypothetical protein